MIKIGMIIGDRYEILEKIGTGGMSDVYKAKDHKLNRFVAVKVLKQEFSENANFVSKFQVEAQAAAGLMHANIVNVYDVGDENGIYYFVMELVEGITLKRYIEKKSRLSVRETISIAIQVSMGIEAAHNNHIIHRDIKPQNIIISKEGKVKVTDFGIAKAATSNTITSNVMGSVHYTSPEQARGGFSDEKSDIYSLGITMFEMLTGRVPFNGDTTVAIAIKHIQEELPTPKDFVPEIPVSVEKIVLKCCQKSPDRRYQSMGEVIADLKESMIRPDVDFVHMVDPDTESATRVVTQRDMDSIKQASDDQRESAGSVMRLNEKPPVKKRPQRPVKEKRSEYDDREAVDSGMERIITIIAIIAAIIIGVVVIGLLGTTLGLFGGDGDTEESGIETVGKVEMIDVQNMEVTAAQDALEKLGLKTSVEYEQNKTFSTGRVIKASAEKGDMIDSGETIVLTVSLGGEGVEVPSIVGKTVEEAKNTLEKLGFVVKMEDATSSDVEEGHIISQTPDSSQKAPFGSNVTIVVSKGAADSKVAVPKLLGKTEPEAMAILVENGLELGKVTEVINEEYPADQVCAQAVSEGSYVDAGTKVDISISLGGKQHTYSFSGNINGPTPEEDPAYKSGVQVNVVITTADGAQLLNTTTSAFPIAVNYSGITSPTGTLSFTYLNTIEATTITDPETGEVTEIPGSSEPAAVTRAIEFTKEDE